MSSSEVLKGLFVISLFSVFFCAVVLDKGNQLRLLLPRLAMRDPMAGWTASRKEGRLPGGAAGRRPACQGAEAQAFRSSPVACNGGGRDGAAAATLAPPPHLHCAGRGTGLGVERRRGNFS
jgi:hypothetical protein